MKIIWLHIFSYHHKMQSIFQFIIRDLSTTNKKRCHLPAQREWRVLASKVFINDITTNLWWFKSTSATLRPHTRFGFVIYTPHTSWCTLPNLILRGNFPHSWGVPYIMVQFGVLRKYHIIKISISKFLVSFTNRDKLNKDGDCVMGDYVMDEKCHPRKTVRRHNWSMF